MTTRTEQDSLGTVAVPKTCLWGAQTQRSLENFPIGHETMPLPLLKAFAHLKAACATANAHLLPERMTPAKEEAILAGTTAMLQGTLWDEFPLKIWQTGSGTQTNMNVNEVLTHFGNRFAEMDLLHPNDDVNLSQSSNDIFPSAMHIAAVSEISDRLLPAIDTLIVAFRQLEDANPHAVKCGRTHLQDATPLTFAQEVSGWRSSLEIDRNAIENSLEPLRYLALGGTAVGTGLNAPAGFDKLATQNLSNAIGTAFYPAENKFHALSSKSELVSSHGTLKALASDLLKIANDIRWLSSGPRCGLGEINLPANEPGSSIMPGKVNPTQCEAVTMVAVQVMANDVAVGLAASQGNFQLNVFMPVCAYNFLQSVELLSDVCDSFAKRCVSGITVNGDKMQENLHKSLMTATALSPIIGYESTAHVVQKAHQDGITLKEACIALGVLDEDTFDKVYRPEDMV